MARRPPLLDVRAELDRAAGVADAGIDAEIERVRDRIEAAERRDPADREGELEVARNELLALEVETNQEAARQLRAVRNRLRIFSEAVAGTDADVAVVESSFREAESAPFLPVEETRQVHQSVTVTNNGEARDVTVTTVFDDENYDRLGTVTSDPVRIERNGELTVALEATVPAGAAHYATTVETAADEEATARTGTGEE